MTICSRSGNPRFPGSNPLLARLGLILFQKREFEKLCGAFLLLAAGFPFFTGCSKTPASVPNGPSASPRWTWETYPLVEKMRLGTLSCRVLPKSSSTINSPQGGVLRVYVDRQQTNLPAGFIWAEFGPKLLVAESNALAEAKRKLDEKEKILLELEIPKQKLKTAREIAEAQRQLAYLELLSTNQGLAVIVPPKDRSATPEALKQAKQELKLLQDFYGYLQATNLAVLGIDTQAQRLELEHRQLEFERLRSQAQFKLTSDSQLSVSFPLSEGVSEYQVNIAQELAVLRDLSSIQLRTILSDPSWATLPTERLAAIIRLPDGTKLEAPFAFKKLEKAQLREDVAYYFQFPTNRADAAARMMGTDVSCELWLNLPERARVIPKLTLVINQPTATFQNRRWNEGVAQMAPGSRVLVEGQTDLAIAPPRTHPKNESEEK